MSLNTKLATAPNTSDTYILKASGSTIGDSIMYQDSGGGMNVAYQGTTGGARIRITPDSPQGYIEAYSGGGSFYKLVLATGGLSVRNGLSTVLMDIASGGAATFSSSVTSVGGGASSALFSNNNGAGGTAQYYQDFGNGAGFVAGRILRGNGASGYESNGLNIDSYQGLQIKVNALGGTGGTFTVTGGAATFSSSVTATTETTASSLIQQWLYKSEPSNYKLQLNSIVSTGIVKYSFDLTNNTTAYSNNLVLDRGNVGIGTSSPAKPLHVYSTNTNANAQLKLTNSGTTPSAYLGMFSNTFYINSGGTYDSGWSLDGSVGVAAVELYSFNGGSQINFATAASNTTPTERMRITSGGDLWLGNDSNPYFEIANGGSTNVLSGIRWVIGSGRVNYGGVEMAASSADNGYMVLKTRNSGSTTERMRIFASGNVRFSSQVYGNTVASPRTLYIQSDGELGGISSIRESKTNINQIESNWLMQLNPVSFNYRKKDEDGNYTNEHYEELFYGLIAEETELVNKEICTYNDDKLVGIEYSKLVPVLLKAVQEQQAQIEAQQQQINSLINR